MFERPRKLLSRARSASGSCYLVGTAFFLLIAASIEFAAQARWALWPHAALLVGAGGGALLLVHRLHEREVRIERRRAELSAVLHSADSGICLVDRAGRVTFANVAMERIWDELGLPADGSVWERLGPLAQKTDRPEGLLAAFARLVDDPRLELVEEAAVVTVGRSFVGRTVPVVDSSGVLLGRVFTLRETTAERRAERLKDELVSTVSHELRTPLTSVLGFLDTVLEGYAGPITADQRQFLSIARKSADRLVRLVEDLLFTAKIEAGSFALEPGEVALSELASACVADLRATAAAAGIQLELQLGDGDVDPLWADAGRLRQVLDNLVANAIKFTPAGGRIVLRTGSEGNRAFIEVEDSGIGIPSDELAFLFHPFFRATTAVERHVPGTGLGLRICKAIVDAHGGTIRAESDEGRGATFRIELPLRSAPVAAGTKVA